MQSKGVMVIKGHVLGWGAGTRAEARGSRQMLGSDQEWGHILGAKAKLEHQGQGLQVLGSRNEAGLQPVPQTLGLTSLPGFSCQCSGAVSTAGPSHSFWPFFSFGTFHRGRPHGYCPQWRWGMGWDWTAHGWSCSFWPLWGRWPHTCWWTDQICGSSHWWGLLQTQEKNMVPKSCGARLNLSHTWTPGPCNGGGVASSWHRGLTVPDLGGAWGKAGTGPGSSLDGVVTDLHC